MNSLITLTWREIERGLVGTVQCCSDNRSWYIISWRGQVGAWVPWCNFDHTHDFIEYRSLGEAQEFCRKHLELFVTNVITRLCDNGDKQIVISVENLAEALK